MKSINKLEDVIELLRILDTRLYRLLFDYEKLNSKQIKKEIEKIRGLLSE